MLKASVKGDWRIWRWNEIFSFVCFWIRRIWGKLVSSWWISYFFIVIQSNWFHPNEAYKKTWRKCHQFSLEMFFCYLKTSLTINWFSIINHLTRFHWSWKGWLHRGVKILSGFMLKMFVNNAPFLIFLLISFKRGDVYIVNAKSLR